MAIIREEQLIQLLHIIMDIVPDMALVIMPEMVRGIMRDIMPEIVRDIVQAIMPDTTMAMVEDRLPSQDHSVSEQVIPETKLYFVLSGLTANSMIPCMIVMVTSIIPGRGKICYVD